MIDKIPETTSLINASKYLIEPIPVDEYEAKTLRVPTLMTRRLPVKISAQKADNTLTQRDHDLCIASLPFVDEKTGQFKLELKDIEQAYLVIFGVKTDRNRVIDSYYNLYNTNIKINAKSYNDNGKVLAGEINLRILTDLGFFDDKGKETIKTINRERTGHKYTKQIYGRFHDTILQGLRGNLDGYTNVKIKFFKDYYKQLNSKEKQLILPLLSEGKDAKDIKESEISKIYDFAKRGKKEFEADIKHLKELGLIAESSVLKQYKQYKNSYFLHLVKGESLKLSIGQPTSMQLSLISSSQAESPSIINEQELLDSKKLIDNIKKLREKRGFTLIELVDKLQSCLEDLIKEGKITEQEAEQDYKIKDKGMLSRRLSGERKFTDTETLVVTRLLEVY